MGKCRNVSFGLYTMSISQTPAFQKLESRWGYYTKQDYSVSQVTSKIAWNNFSECLLIDSSNQYLWLIDTWYIQV